jgi:hypothetical protein
MLARMRDDRLPVKDKAIIGMLAFFLIVAVLEAWWLFHTDRLVALAESGNIWARLFRVYGDCDRTYYDQVTSLPRTLEAINVWITQALNVWLIYAIIKRTHYRHALQLCVASYLTYSLVLYYGQAHLAGYADMKVRSAYTYFLFYGVNAPWFVFYLYMAYDSFVTITRGLAQLARGRGGQRVSSSEVRPVGVVVDDESARA